MGPPGRGAQAARRRLTRGDLRRPLAAPSVSRDPARTCPRSRHDAGQLHAGHAHPLEGVAGELERGLGLGIGDAVDAKAPDRLHLAPATGPGGERTGAG